MFDYDFNQTKIICISTDKIYTVTCNIIEFVLWSVTIVILVWAY